MAFGGYKEVVGLLEDPAIAAEVSEELMQVSIFQVTGKGSCLSFIRSLWKTLHSESQNTKAQRHVTAWGCIVCQAYTFQVVAILKTKHCVRNKKSF